MNIAFSVTGPDLARALAEIVRGARGAGGTGPAREPGTAPPPPPGDTVSPAARRELSGSGGAGDERA